MIGYLTIPGRNQRYLLQPKMLDLKAWAENGVSYRDPQSFLRTLTLAPEPGFLASIGFSWKWAKMIEARGKEQGKEKKKSRKYCKN